MNGESFRGREGCITFDEGFFFTEGVGGSRWMVGGDAEEILRKRV